MIGITSFARSRHWDVNILIIVATAALIYACGPLAYSLNPSNGYLVAVVAQLRLIPAISIQATLYNGALHRQERLTSRRGFAIFRVTHVVLLTGLAVIAVVVASRYIHLAPDTITTGTHIRGVGSFAIARNMLALTGAALLTGYILGARFGWTVPLAWAVIPYFITTPQPGLPATPWFRWGISFGATFAPRSVPAVKRPPMTSSAISWPAVIGNAKS